MGYLNVLPLCHPLEIGAVPGDFVVTAGVPRTLNNLMAQGELDVSSNSSIEYARRPDQYLLVPDLAIGAKGAVQSVLLLSRLPPHDLHRNPLLVSTQTHTSGALLQLLMIRHFRIEPDYVEGDAEQVLAAGDKPEGMLLIGDQALHLRNHPEYPHRLDLGEAWRFWTGLPFIFGVWLVQREAAAKNPERIAQAVDAMLRAKAWGARLMDEMVRLAARQCPLSEREMASYFRGLSYDLREQELQGLNTFFKMMAETGLIKEPPAMEFIKTS
jgi:chorismate dehydratase